MKRYMKFLELADRIEFNCDQSCITLLEKIAVQESIGQPLTVNHAMGLTSIASPATLHRRLDLLRDAGYINHVFKENNRRTKHLVTTHRADTYFKALEQCLVHSLGD